MRQEERGGSKMIEEIQLQEAWRGRADKESDLWTSENSDRQRERPNEKETKFGTWKYFKVRKQINLESTVTQSAFLPLTLRVIRHSPKLSLCTKTTDISVTVVV